MWQVFPALALDPLYFLLIHIYRVSHLGTLYLGSLLVLLVYSILYGLTAKEARWMGAITSAAVIVLGVFVGIFQH